MGGPCDPSHIWMNLLDHLTEHSNILLRLGFYCFIMGCWWQLWIGEEQPDRNKQRKGTGFHTSLSMILKFQIYIFSQTRTFWIYLRDTENFHFLLHEKNWLIWFQHIDDWTSIFESLSLLGGHNGDRCLRPSDHLIGSTSNQLPILEEFLKSSDTATKDTFRTLSQNISKYFRTHKNRRKTNILSLWITIYLLNIRYSTWPPKRTTTNPVTILYCISKQNESTNQKDLDPMFQCSQHYLYKNWDMQAKLKCQTTENGKDVRYILCVYIYRDTLEYIIAIK